MVARPTDPAEAQVGQKRVAGLLVDGVTEHFDPTGRRAINGAENVEQRRLAAARGAAQHHKLASVGTLQTRSIAWAQHAFPSEARAWPRSVPPNGIVLAVRRQVDVVQGGHGVLAAHDAVACRHGAADTDRAAVKRQHLKHRYADQANTHSWRGDAR